MLSIFPFFPLHLSLAVDSVQGRKTEAKAALGKQDGKTSIDIYKSFDLACK